MCETACDHLIAGARVEWFTFCPMCGLPLQKREAVPA